MRISIVYLFALLIAGSATAASFDPPKRKSGLWELKVQHEKMPGPQVMQQCVDQKTDDMMKDSAQAKEATSCSKNELRKEGANIVAESVCKVNGSSAKTRAVFSGNFESAYKVDSRSTYEPPLHGMREATTKMEAKWLGPCKAGQKPGDVMIQGIPGMNMEELMKGMKR
jgi:hypothetical protein